MDLSLKNYMIKVTSAPAKPRTTAAEKIKFIQENFPEVQNCDPHTDIELADKIKMKLCSAGFYKHDRIHQSTTDEAIKNLMLKAKGDQTTKRRSGAQLRDSQRTFMGGSI